MDKQLMKAILKAMLAVAVGMASSAGAVPFFKGFGTDGMQPGEHGVAAFYQHQKGYQQVWPPGTPPVAFPPPPPDPQPPDAMIPGYDNGNWWEATGGWCGTTAWINSLYFFSTHGFPRLFDHSNLGPAHQGKTPTQRFAYANEDLAKIAGFCATPDDVREYIKNYGYERKFELNEYFWDDTTGKVMQSTAAGNVESRFTTMIELYREELLRSEDVVMELEHKTAGTDWLGWGLDINFHVVTGAGVETDPTMSKIWIADPDQGKGGRHWGFPYGANDPVPEGEPFYTMISLEADGRTFKEMDPYAKGARINKIFTLSHIPEPGSLLLLVVGLAALLGARRSTPARRSGGGSAPR